MTRTLAVKAARRRSLPNLNPGRIANIDLLLGVLALSIYGVDLSLLAGRAIIVLLIIVVILAGRTRSRKRVLAWTYICIGLTISGYFVRHGRVFDGVILGRRFICVSGFVAAACVILRNQWLEAELRLRARLLDRAAAAIFVRDPNDEITAWSKGAELLYGWTEAEVLGRRAIDLFGCPDPALLQQGYKALSAVGRWQGSLVRQTKARRHIAVLCQWAVQRDAVGKIVAILESGTDVTAHQLIEAQIRSSEAHFRGVFEMAAACIWEEDFSAVLADLDDLKAAGCADIAGYYRDHPQAARQVLAKARITDINKAAVALLQAPGMAEVKARDGAMVLHCLDDCLPGFLAAAGGCGAFAGEMTLTTWRGEIRHILLSAKFGAGAVSDPRLRLSATDITARKRAENELVELEEKLAEVTRSATRSELTSLISREIERPLASIIAHSRKAGALLRSEARPTEQVNEIMRLVVLEATAASKVVGEVRRFLKEIRKAVEG